MISHKHKCIFVHVQRTAGSSVEKWLCGEDWWRIEPETKHMLVSQAKRKYSKYWHDYFKFSIVRNPWDRVVSMTKFGEFLGVHLKNRIINVDKYKNKYGYPLTIENDPRFSKRKNLVNENHSEHQVYQNILDDELDFVATYENLYEDMKYVKDKIGIKTPFNYKRAQTKNKKDYRTYYNEEKIEEIRDLYYWDVVNYNYEFE